MRHLILMFIIPWFNQSFGQAPSDDNHWSLYKEWNFKAMSISDLGSQWYIQDWLHALDHDNGDVEPQYYQPENVTINSTSGLALTVKEESVYGKVVDGLSPTTLMSDGNTNARWFGHTSGYVETKDSLKYGYIEGRLKIPYGYDYFPAFWTFKKSAAAANGAEIDIFEMLPSDNIYPPFFPYNYDIQKTNVHLLYGAGAIGRNENCEISDYTQYHTYGVEWNPSKIIWYFDNEIIRVLINPGVHDYTKTILNVALTPFVPLNSSLTNYPADMFIDYVKWYKLNQSCATIVNDCSFWFSGYVPTVKKSITIGAGGCGNVQPLGSSLSLRATNFVEINGEFEVPIGAELYIDVNGCY